MIYADRLKHTVATTGTGTYTLGSVPSGFQSFTEAGFVDGDTIYYSIVMGGAWEVGKGTLGGTQTTLTRDTIFDSSNSGNAVDWIAGDKTLFNDFPAHRLNEFEELNTANGFDLMNSSTMGEVTWDNTARTISIAPASGETEFSYWVNGYKYVKTSTITSAAIPDVAGEYYFYLLPNGTINYVAAGSVTLEVFYEYAILALVYWNSTASVGIPFKEQHGHRMDSADHEMEHMTTGARYASGFAPNNMGQVGFLDVFDGVASGKFYDEDIAHTIPAETTIPFLYRLGAGDGEWTWSTADNKIGFMNGGTDVCWNENTGTTWQLTPADVSHDYILHFLVAMSTFDGYSNFAKIIDQHGYSNRSAARDAIEGAKKQLIMDGLPSPEFCFIGCYIARRSGDLEDLADGSLYLDLRGSSSRGTGGDSVASNVAADITIADSGSLITATNVEDALQEHRTAIDLNTAKNTYPSTDATKVGFISVTQSVDLDTMESDIATNNSKTGVTDEISSVVEDTTPQLGGDLDLNSKALTNEYTAAVLLAATDLCYLNSSGKMAKTGANTEATTSGYLAVCTEAISANAVGTFVYTGRLTGYTGLTVGGICYVSNTDGEITQTRPTTGFVRVVGYADSATSIVFQPSPVWVEI